MKFTIAILFIIGTTIQIVQSAEIPVSDNTAEQLWDGAKEETKEEYNEAKDKIENTPEEMNKAALNVKEYANAALDRTKDYVHRAIDKMHEASAKAKEYLDATADKTKEYVNYAINNMYKDSAETKAAAEQTAEVAKSVESKAMEDGKDVLSSDL